MHNFYVYYTLYLGKVPFNFLCDNWINAKGLSHVSKIHKVNVLNDSLSESMITACWTVDKMDIVIKTASKASPLIKALQDVEHCQV